MQFVSFLVASLTSSALVAAQFTCTSTSGNPATFNQCVTNSQVSPSGGIGAKNPTDACASIQTDQAQYYNCLCDRSTSLIGCYTSFCPADSSATSAQQFQTQFCQAAGSNPVTTGTTSGTSNQNPSKSLASLPSGGGTITVSSSPKATTGSSSNNAYATGVWSNAMVFGEFGIMLVLANVL